MPLRASRLPTGRPLGGHVGFGDQTEATGRRGRTHGDALGGRRNWARGDIKDSPAKARPTATARASAERVGGLEPFWVTFPTESANPAVPAGYSGSRRFVFVSRSVGGLFEKNDPSSNGAGNTVGGVRSTPTRLTTRQRELYIFRLSIKPRRGRRNHPANPSGCERPDTTLTKRIRNRVAPFESKTSRSFFP